MLISNDNGPLTPRLVSMAGQVIPALAPASTRWLEAALTQTSLARTGTAVK